MLSRKVMAKAVGAWAMALVLFNAGAAFADGDCMSCGTGYCAPARCSSHHCPPALKHCAEGPPRICVRLGCPKPICNPCTQPNWGYYETCWRPWPFPPDYSHCAVVPPAATIALSQHPYENNYNPYGPGAYPPPMPGGAPGPMPHVRPMPPIGSGNVPPPNFTPPNYPPQSSPNYEVTPAPRENRPGL
ncbi:MAG: hypothetical protein U0744_00745 [Gemmataceae bacterium]